MEANPMKNAARKQRRRDRLGPDATCLLCGCNDLEKLTKPRRSLLEQHHLAGRKTDEVTVTVCLNCHRGLQEGLKDGGLEGREPASILHRVYNILVAFADFFRRLADRCADWARQLAEFIRRIEDLCPSCRDTLKGGNP